MPLKQEQMLLINMDIITSFSPSVTVELSIFHKDKTGPCPSKHSIFKKKNTCIWYLNLLNVQKHVNRILILYSSVFPILSSTDPQTQCLKVKQTGQKVCRRK